MDRIDIMQSQNFEFLRGAWPELASLAGFAEHYAQIDPQSALTKLRNFAERSVAIVYARLDLPKAPCAKFMEQLSSDVFEAVTPIQHTAEELEQLKKQATTKGQQVAHDLHFNEATTRKYLIDLQLTQVGWHSIKCVSVPSVNPFMPYRPRRKF